MSAHERERLSAYLDGELSPPDAAAVEAHLAACAECAALLADLAAVDERFSGLPAEAPAGYFDAFAARVRARVEAEPRRAAPRRVPAWTWAAAAALLLAVLTPLTLKSRVAVPPAAAPSSVPEPEPRAPGPARDSARAVEQRAEAGPAAAENEAERPHPPARLDRPAAGRGERQGPAETAVSQTADEGGGVEGGVPGGVVGGVLGGRPQAPPPPPPQAAVAAAKAESAERESAATGFGATAGEARTKAAEVPRPVAGPAVVLSDAVARDEADDAARAFARLAAAAPRTAEDWRRAREGWLAFAAAHASDPRADEARVRAVLASFEALRASGTASDRRAFEEDAAAYLARGDAAQGERVRAIVRRAEELPR